MYEKNIYLNSVERCEDMIDHLSYGHNVELKPEK